MTLRLRVETLDDVPEQFRSEYIAAADGGFSLDIEGEHQGEVAMRRARDNEKAEHKKTKARIEELVGELDTMREQLTNGTANAEQVSTSWQRKYDAKVAELQGLVDAGSATITKMTVGQTATELANRLFIVPEFGRDSVMRRLTTELVDGVPTVRVLDQSGTPGVMTVAELEAEFRARKDLAPVLKAPGGSGSGTPPPGSPLKTKQPSDFTEAERLDLLKSDPVKFNEIFGKKGQ